MNLFKPVAKEIEAKCKISKQENTKRMEIKKFAKAYHGITPERKGKVDSKLIDEEQVKIQEAHSKNILYKKQKKMFLVTKKETETKSFSSDSKLHSIQSLHESAEHRLAEQLKEELLDQIISLYKTHGKLQKVHFKYVLLSQFRIR